MRWQHLNRIAASLFVLVLLASFRSSLAAQDGTSGAAATRATTGASRAIDVYCASCHDGRMRSASGTLLHRFDLTQIPANAEAWARAYRQLQARAMPPVGAPRPDRGTIDVVLATIEEGLGAYAQPRARLSNAEIATRLATVLWNSGPDEALLQDVERNGLNDAATLERHVVRMLADDRADAFVSRFFFPWLELDALSKADPDEKYFPDYDASLLGALAQETRLFLLSQLRENRDPIDLWRADYTFLNGQLATHYGIANVTGPQFRRVALPSPERAGLLGHGSVLMVTSRHQRGVDAGYTSPATRAKWVRLHFLGATLPDGFPGAQPVKPELPITPQTRSLPAEPCVNCHRNFFPLGYALENFDPLGRWRTHDQIGPVDTSGTFTDGASTNGVIELRRALLQHPEAFRTTITEKLIVYAATGSVSATSGTPGSLAAAARTLRGMPAPRWSALIAAIVQER